MNRSRTTTIVVFGASMLLLSAPSAHSRTPRTPGPGARAGAGLRAAGKWVGQARTALRSARVRTISAIQKRVTTGQARRDILAQARRTIDPAYFPMNRKLMIKTKLVPLSSKNGSKHNIVFGIHRVERNAIGGRHVFGVASGTALAGVPAVDKKGVMRSKTTNIHFDKLPR